MSTLHCNILKSAPLSGRNENRLQRPPPPRCNALVGHELPGGGLPALSLVLALGNGVGNNWPGLPLSRQRRPLRVACAKTNRSKPRFPCPSPDERPFYDPYGMHIIPAVLPLARRRGRSPIFDNSRIRLLFYLPHAKATPPNHQCRSTRSRPPCVSRAAAPLIHSHLPG